MISPARTAAFDVLLAVETKGAWAADLLLERTAALDSRDAGLAQEITLGSLRRQVQLDYVIARHAPRKLDAEVRIALRVGVYQILWLDRVPRRAAVNESVELVKRARKSSAAGMVNAVLRKTAPTEWPDRTTALSTPAWLLARWDAEFGVEIADRIAAEFLKPPERFVRGHVPGLTLEPAEVAGSYRVLAGETRGVRLQDIGSQSIVPLLDLRPGLSFLDLCAAPGNKTAQALETPLFGVACDRYLHRLRDVACGNRVVLDATRDLPFRVRFDRILVDAPCSGTGTLGRNPEIKWRLQPHDIEDLNGRQSRILDQALKLLAPGGRLVYSTCSLERRENEDVVAARSSGYQIEREMRRVPGLQAGDGFYAAVLSAT